MTHQKLSKYLLFLFLCLFLLLFFVCFTLCSPTNHLACRWIRTIPFSWGGVEAIRQNNHQNEVQKQKNIYILDILWKKWGSGVLCFPSQVFSYVFGYIFLNQCVASQQNWFLGFFFFFSYFSNFTCTVWLIWLRKRPRWPAFKQLKLMQTRWVKMAENNNNNCNK